MKINHYLDRSWFNGLRYTLHIMKIIIILLVLSIGNSFSMTYSQNTLLSLDINKQSIKEVIGIIEKKSEYVFFFSDNVRQGSYRNPEGLKYNHLLKYLLHLPISLLIVFKYLL